VFAEEPNRRWTGAELAKLFEGVAAGVAEIWGITPTKEK
jgi:phage shock protein PspC (stress-responsive transcriptional regulator)